MRVGLFLLILITISNGINAQGLETFEQLLRIDFSQADSIDYEIIEAQKAFIEKDKGLRLNTSAGTNDFGGFETGNIFRLRAGLEWNILDEGFYDRKNHLKALDIEKEIISIRQDLASDDLNYNYLYNYLIQCFNDSKLEIIEDKFYLLEILIKRYETLYHAHGATYQDLIQLYNQAEESILLKESLLTYNEYYKTNFWNGLPNLIPSYLPILDLKVPAILDSIQTDSSDLLLAELQFEKSQIEDKLVNRTRLSVYNNAYWRPFAASNQSNYFINNIGVRFSTNLSNRNRKKN